MRNNSVWLFVVLGVLLSGCGGGGGSLPTTNPTGSPITFSAGTNQTAKSGDLVLTGDFATVSSGTLSQTKGSGAPSFGLPTAAQGGHLSVNNSFELSLDTAPTGALHVSYPTTAAHPLVAVKIGDSFVAVKTTLTNGVVQFDLSAEMTNAVSSKSRSLSSIWQWTIGSIGQADDDTELSVHQVSTNPNATSTRTVLGVHGVMCNYKDMTPIVSAFVAQTGNQTGSSLAYEWQDAPNNGTISYLKGYLKGQPFKSVLLVLDSYGCLVGREALKDPDVQKAVYDVVFVAGPHEGSSWAKAGDAVYGLTTNWLNHIYSGACPYNDVPAIDQMVKSNSYLANLNTPGSGQLPRIGYFLYAGNIGLGSAIGDGVVGNNSALANDIDLHAFTAGSINKEVIPGSSHADIFRSSSNVSEIVRFYLAHKAVGSLSVYAGDASGNTVIDVDYITGTWFWQVSITNNTNTTIILEDLGIPGYRRDGGFDSEAWYNTGVPSDAFYPTNYVGWGDGNSLGAGQSTTLYFQEWTDYNQTPIWNQANSQLLAFTVLPTLRYSVGSDEYQQDLGRLVLHDGTIYPSSNLDTRSFGQPAPGKLAIVPAHR